MAGHSPKAITTTTVPKANGTTIKESKLTPVDGSATRATPTGVNADRAVATATPPTAPTTAIASVRAMPKENNWVGDMPIALSVGRDDSPSLNVHGPWSLAELLELVEEAPGDVVAGAKL